MNKDDLMLYIKEKFPGTIDEHWNWDLLENILDFAFFLAYVPIVA